VPTVAAPIKAAEFIIVWEIRLRALGLACSSVRSLQSRNLCDRPHLTTVMCTRITVRHRRHSSGQLNPCPRCGSSATSLRRTELGRYAATCFACGCEVGAATPEEVVEIWNFDKGDG
jgi:hypothetical protein